MKAFIIRLSLILAIVVALLIPALFMPVKYDIEIPQVMLDFAKMYNLGELTRINDNLYMTSNGSYVQRFESQSSGSTSAEAGYAE
ncbi:unnamed protein product, partial [marine sediment metagenome]